MQRPGDAANDAEAAAILEELRRLEPIFHTTEFGTRQEDFEGRMAPDYFEIGASGRRYSRGFILRHLEKNPPVDAAEAGWVCSQFALRALGAETFLVTYRLQQGRRVTRRATIWRRGEGGWQILYHQGTVVTGEDDTRPGVE